MSTCGLGLMVLNGTGNLKAMFLPSTALTISCEWVATIQTIGIQIGTAIPCTSSAEQDHMRLTPIQTPRLKSENDRDDNRTLAKSVAKNVLECAFYMYSLIVL